MSCYHPLAAVKTGFLTDKGKDEWKVISKFNPELESEFFDEDFALVPCGKCLGCRLDYSRRWADRMVMELDHFKGKALFLTLTYNDDHVPKVFEYDEETGECLDTVKTFTLQKKDLQDFLKRLRKKYSDRECKFYACGEYGERYMRPHFHIVLFGLSFEDFPKKHIKQVGFNEFNDPYYTVEEIQNLWSICLDRKNKIYDPIGFVCVSEVSYKTMAYVARYTQKKFLNANGLLYEMLGKDPEFATMSRNPGIGKRFFDDHPEFLGMDNIYINDGSESKKISLTKDYLLVLEKTNPELYNEIKVNRKLLAKDSLLLQLQQSDLDFGEYYEMKERQHLARVTSLKRNKVI